MPSSKRNSSCLDDSEHHWEAWRYEPEPSESQDQDYAVVYYPGRGAGQHRGTGHTPHSRVSPASSSSAVSGTPSSDSRFTELHDRLEKFSSYIREEEGEQRTSAGSSGPARRSVVHTPRHLEEYQAPHVTIETCTEMCYYAG